MNPGAAIAIGVGIGAALAATMGPAGFAIGVAIAAALWTGTKDKRHGPDE